MGWIAEDLKHHFLDIDHRHLQQWLHLKYYKSHVNYLISQLVLDFLHIQKQYNNN